MNRVPTSPVTVGTDVWLVGVAVTACVVLRVGVAVREVPEPEGVDWFVEAGTWDCKGDEAPVPCGICVLVVMVVAGAMVGGI
jgi:hypothetical protein